MRFGCLDLLITMILFAVVAYLSAPLWAYLPPYLQPLAEILGAMVVCLAVMFGKYKLLVAFGRYKTMGKPSDENKRVSEE
jgi:hypothetical protein